MSAEIERLRALFDRCYWLPPAPDHEQIDSLNGTVLAFSRCEACFHCQPGHKMRSIFVNGRVRVICIACYSYMFKQVK